MAVTDEKVEKVERPPTIPQRTQEDESITKDEPRLPKQLPDEVHAGAVDKMLAEEAEKKTAATETSSEESATSEKKDEGKKDEKAVKTPTEEEKKKAEELPAGVKKRFDTLTRQARTAERRLNTIEQQNQQLLEERDFLRDVVKKGEKPPGDSKSEEEKPPNKDDFEDYNEYLVAKSAYETAKKMEARFKDIEAQLKTSSKESTVSSAKAKEEAEMQAKTDAGLKEFSDFKEVAMVEIYTGEMKHVIRTSPIGHKIAYHLGSNPDLTDELAALSPDMQFRRLGALEAQLESKKEEESSSEDETSETKSDASDSTDIKPLKSSETKAFDPQDPKTSNKDYRAWRDEEDRKRRGL